MPVLDFSKNGYAQFLTTGGLGSSGKKYGGPRYKLSQVASAAATLGSLLPFPAPAANSSYELDFLGPALQCATIEGSMRDQFVHNISESMGCNIELQGGSGNDSCHIQVLYTAWAPGDLAVAFEGATKDEQDGFSGNTIGQLGANPGDSPAALFIASQPTLDNSQPWNFLNCSLYNATYHVAVNFTGGIQTVDVMKNITAGVGYYPTLDIVGSASVNGKDPINGVDAYLMSTLDQFGYESVMDAFGRLIVGQISVYYRNAAGGFNFSTQQTSIMTTSLANTKDLGSIFQIAETCSDGHSACGSKSTKDNLNITATAGLSLKDAAEQLFENITLSLFSNDIFL
jgi:hypothetical protein